MTSAIRRLSIVDSAHGRRYLCFPPAGGTLTTLRDLVNAAPRVEVWGVAYPGRGDRIAVPLPATLEELAEQVACDLVEQFGPEGIARTVLVGFSMGAFVALELAQRVDTHCGTAPAALVVVGATAPHRRVPETYAQTDDASLARLLARDGLTPVADYRDCPEAWDYALTLLRGDLLLTGAYDGPVRATAPCPIAAVCGGDEPAVDDATSAWRTWATGPFTTAVVHGGHLGLLGVGRGAEFWSWLREIEESTCPTSDCP